MTKNKLRMEKIFLEKIQYEIWEANVDLFKKNILINSSGRIGFLLLEFINLNRANI